MRFQCRGLLIGVYGQQSDHGHMENDELVLYNPDAISPKYILLYDFQGNIFLIKQTIATILMDT